MGGDQSHERKASEDETEDQEQPADAHAHADADGSDEEPSGELPQCQMGNRKVDNMCFMISCTNWY